MNTNQKPLLSVIIPVYNEQDTIKTLIEKIKRVDVDKQIIVINDGSNDQTNAVLEDLKGIDKIHHSGVNLGKGSSIRKGLEFANGRIVIIQDADLELDPDEYPKLIKPILDGKTKVVYGSRFLNPENKIPFITTLANGLLSLLTSLLYWRRITDMETCYKVLDSKLIGDLKLKAKRFEIEPEITSKLLKMRLKIVEVPIKYSPRTAKAGKKIKFKDGLSAIYALIRLRLSKD